MRVLLDTNIIIHREASRIFNQDIGTLFNWLDKLHFEKCVHPLSIEEISGYQDEEVVNTMKVKIDNYQLLRTESQECETIQKIREKDKNRNDYIDTSLLKEVFNGRIDYLITEDRGIHRKAKELNISEKVYKIDSFLEKLVAENPNLKEYKVLSVKKEYFGNLNIKDDFFQSFIGDYNEFENWFAKKSDKISYVCITDDLKLKNSGIMRDDFALFIPAKHAIKFIDWFNKGKDREVSHWREFYEELIEGKGSILSKENFPYVNYNFVGKVITPIKRTPGWNAYEILQFDILDLLPNEKQLKELKEVLYNGDTDYIKWADYELINNLGHDNREMKQLYKIGEHTKWAINMKWTKD